MVMQTKLQNLHNRNQTAREMVRIIKRYWRDIGEHARNSLQGYFEFVKNIPYQEDPFFLEVVARPAYLLDKELFPKLDCKKKVCLWARILKRIKYPGSLSELVNFLTETAITSTMFFYRRPLTAPWGRPGIPSIPRIRTNNYSKPTRKLLTRN